MNRLILALVLVLAFAAQAAGQARTAERIIVVAFSQLTTGWPDGSTRIVVNGSPTAPCTVGTTMVMAVKLNGVWNCSDLTAGSPAPINATYITQTPHGTLTAEQALSVLATGLVKNTTTTGVLSIATAGVDYLLPNGSGAALTNLNASALATGTVPTARVVTGTITNTRCLRLDASGNIVVAAADCGTGGGSGDALTTNPLSQFAATTSAQLAGVITNETGTNLLVFSDNPVLVTPTIANFVNMGHDHTTAAMGGQLTDAALSTPVGLGKGGTGQTTATAAFNALDPLTTKGDVLTHDGTNSLRVAVGANGNCLKANSGTASGLEWGTCGAGTGDVVGPASATDNAVVRFDTTTGKLVQNSIVTVDDSGNISTTGTVTSGAGGSVAGVVELGEGTAPGLVADTFSIYAPVDVAVGGLALVMPGAAFTGLPKWTNAAGVMTVTQAVASTDYSVPIASGTSALGTTAIASGACATVVTTAATGTATTDVIWWGFNGDPTAVVGYQPSVDGMLTIIAYPSANNVNFKVCNNLSASVTPGAITLNWRVVR